MDERVRNLKPEGLVYEYQFCILCDKESDGTELMKEFGLCRECCQRLLDTVPADRYAHIGRLFIYASRKQLILGDAKLKPEGKHYSGFDELTKHLKFKKGK